MRLPFFNLFLGRRQFSMQLPLLDGFTRACVLKSDTGKDDFPVIAALLMRAIAFFLFVITW
ncbi:hypothetical protein C7W93_14255 [Glaciimonas sp. PCH181]|nr:hypothetical protein C7W93_14255 [Glaciimonas sp. PCH181]